MISQVMRLIDYQVMEMLQFIFRILERNGD